MGRVSGRPGPLIDVPPASDVGALPRVIFKPPAPNIPHPPPPLNTHHHLTSLHSKTCPGFRQCPGSRSAQLDQRHQSRLACRMGPLTAAPPKERRFLSPPSQNKSGCSGGAYPCLSGWASGVEEVHVW